MVKRNKPFLLLLKMQLRNIKKNIAQFLAIIVIGAIATTLFVGLQSNADTFEAQIQETFREGSLPDAFVTTGQYDENDILKLKEILPDDYQVDSRLYLPSKIGNHDVYAVVVDHIPTLSHPYGEGEFSKTTTDDYFAFLDDGWEKKEHQTTYERYNLDDDFVLSLDISSFNFTDDADSLSSPFLLKPDGQNIFKKGNLQLTMQVTGFMEHPENITKANYNPAVCLISYSMFQKSINDLLEKNFTGFGKSLISIYLDRFFGNGFLKNHKQTYFNQYLIKTPDGVLPKEQINKIRSYFNGKEDNNLLLLTKKEEMPFFLTVHADSTQARQFTYVFPFVFFFVAVLVILTTLSQLILKDRTQIGTLKALGLNNHEILFNYIALTSILVLLGMILGLIIGPILVPSILGQKYAILYSLPKRTYHFPWLFGMLTTVGFLLISALVTYIVARSELKLKPVDSMRPVVPKIKKRKKSEKSTKNVILLSVKMAFRNLRLDKFRSFMVIIGILGCTALLVCGFGIEDTVNYGIGNDRDIFLNSDIVLTLNEPVQDETIINELMTIDGIDSIEPYRRREMTYYKEGGNQTTKILYILSKEDSSLGMELPQDGIAISQKIARTIQCELGDEIILGSGLKQKKVKVTKIFNAFYYNCGILPFNSPLLDDEERVFNGAWINVKDKKQADDIADTIKENVPNVSSSVSSDGFTIQIQNVMSGILMMTNAVKVFAILLALVTLYNLALLTYRQRLRDMSTLKVLGFRKREIALTLLTESMVLTFIGVIFGSVLGYPFMLAVLKTNIVELVEYLFHINFVSYIYSFILTFIVAFLINLYFAYHIKKIKMVESLKNVE